MDERLKFVARLAVGDGSSFAKARDLGAWLGLVPRQQTTGGKPRLLGISKRGNTYLRTLLITGLGQPCLFSRRATRHWGGGSER